MQLPNYRMIDAESGQGITGPVSQPAGGLPSIAKPSRPAALSSSPDILALLMALRRRWKAALVLGLMVASTAGAVTYLVIPRSKYTAKATFHISSNPKYIIFEPKERLADYRTYQRTQVALAKSMFVISDALKRPEVSQLATVREHSDPTEWLSQQINIGFPDTSEVLEISISGDRPSDLTVLVNSVVDSYQRLVVDQEQEEREARLEKLKSLWDKYQKSLQEKRSGLRNLSEAIGTNDKEVLTTAHQTKILHRDMAEQEKLRVKFELKKAESELAVLEDQVSKLGQSVAASSLVDEQVEGFPAVQALQRQIAGLTKNYEAKSRLSRIKTDPTLVQAKRQIDSAQKELTALRTKLRTKLAAEVVDSETRDELARINKLRAQVSVARMYKEEIDKELERVQDETKTISRGTQDLSQQQDEIQIVSETARKIGAEVEAMEVELRAPPRIRLVDRATVPAPKDAYRKIKMSSMAAAGSFALVVLGVSFWESRERRINTVDQVVDGLGMRLVGALPSLPDLSRRYDEARGKRIKNILVESIDTIRTMILHASLSDGIRMIMIASAEKGEAKTSLSCNLATSLARGGRRTVLVDADLRSPSVHKLFDITSSPGLSEVLRGEAVLDDVIQVTPALGLHLIPAGQCDPISLQCLAQDGLRNPFEELRRRYDFIIVDSAPVLPVADALLISQVVDAVLFSVLRDVSRIPMVYAAYERLASLNTRMLGVVVSGISGETYGSYYPTALQPDR